MKIRILLVSAMFCLWSAAAVLAETNSKRELAEKAVSADTVVAGEAIKTLRSMGREGLDALFETYAAEIKKFSENAETTDQWKRISFALDSVAMQKDVYASHLFWFTDFEEAREQAQKSNKPILSLRLLGNLNEEFSCANSRFFRAVLYSNAEISKFLRENYILHWESVRPAPKVTIDFGDGRKIERTLTGNSIQYLLDEDGRMIDALPGLYSPSGFLKYITAVQKMNKAIDKLYDGQKELPLLRYRRAMFEDIIAKRQKAVALAKVKLVEPKDGTDALDAAPRAATKMVTEETILRGIADNFSRYERGINLEDWRKLAKLYAGGTRLDAESLAFIRRQNTKTGLTEEEFTKLFQNLEGYIALDTTRNDFIFHTKLYQWLNDGKITILDDFNDKVYAEIFKTPDSDKWLGLYQTDVYTALDGGGIIK